MKKLWIRFIASLPLADTTVLITDGNVVTRRGRTRPALRAELGELARTTGVVDACIHAYTTGHLGCRLSFFGIRDSLHQRFRNVWCANCD